ncbi:MAG: ArnT family glycosyltransferase [Bacteroidota bacterium]
MKILEEHVYKQILVLSILVFIGVHLIYINLPPCSIHVWRQCNTLAVAQNFYDEGLNILEPRVDRRFDSNGITGTAFPLYEWVLALIYKVIGVHKWVPRLFSLAITVTMFVFSFLFLKNITTNKIVAAVSCSLLLWSPEIFYQSINALPDLLALCCGFISLYFITNRDKNTTTLFASYFFLALSGLVKMQYLMIGIFHLIEMINNYFFQRNMNSIVFLQIFLGVMCLMLVFSWYHYSLGLIEESNLRDFGIEIRSACNLTDAYKTIKKNTISDFPELVFGFANTLVILLGIYFSQKNWKHHYFISFAILIGIYITYHLLELRQMDVHHYYMMPIYFSSLALLYQGISFLMQKRFTFIILFLLLLQPALACVRIIPARWGKSDLGISSTFSDEKKLNELKRNIPANAKVIAGPDESGCIYLYFLHKKGFGYERAFQLSTFNNGKPLIEDYIHRGAAYLITSNESDVKNDTLVTYYHEIKKLNEFYIIQLKK